MAQTKQFSNQILLHKCMFSDEVLPDEFNLADTEKLEFNNGD